MAANPTADWDQRYREGYGRREASPLLVAMRHLLPPGGEALEIAMGAGRNALYLAQHSFRVTGIDFSRVALGQCLERARALSPEATRRGGGLAIDAILADLERFPLPRERYDLVLSFYYHQRSICPQMEAALKPGGVVVFETYTREQIRRGFEGGPRDPTQLLGPGELRRLFPGLEELYYREGIFDEGQGPKAIASLIARKPGRET